MKWGDYSIITRLTNKPTLFPAAEEKIEQIGVVIDRSLDHEACGPNLAGEFLASCVDMELTFRDYCARDRGANGQNVTA